jgi:hypothetical protein
LIDQLLDLGGRQVELPGGFGNRRLALNKIQNQRAFSAAPSISLRPRPSSYSRVSLLILTPEQNSTGSLHLRREVLDMKVLVADLTPENRLLR